MPARSTGTIPHPLFATRKIWSPVCPRELATHLLGKRYRTDGGDDDIFPPNYTNRATAARIFQRKLHLLLDRTELKHAPRGWRPDGYGSLKVRR